MKTKKIIIGIVIVVVVLVAFIFLGVPVLEKMLHEHDWRGASCEHSKTCISCGEEEGEPLGHVWVDATCETAKTCSRCKKTDGQPLGHVWKEATCVTAQVCLECEKVDGLALGHDWSGSACDSTDPCKRCGEAKVATSHTFSEAKDCKTYKKCTKCSYTTDIHGDHSFKSTVWKDACPNCGELIHEVKLNSANWKNYFDFEIETYGSFMRIVISPKYKQCYIYSNSKVKIKVVQKWQSSFGWESKVKTIEIDLKDTQVTERISGSDYIWGSSITTQVISVSGEMRYFADRLYVKPSYAVLG